MEQVLFQEGVLARLLQTGHTLIGPKEEDHKSDPGVDCELFFFGRKEINSN